MLMCINCSHYFYILKIYSLFFIYSTNLVKVFKFTKFFHLFCKKVETCIWIVSHSNFFTNLWAFSVLPNFIGFKNKSHK
jgi:hypothetical protein